MTFKELNIAEPILKALQQKNYVTPTPIQIQAIPIVMKGGDLLGIAQTGTGKTAAFAIPIIQQLMLAAPKHRNRDIKALVITPTRELAIQIEESFSEYGRFSGIRNTVIFGGVNQNSQVHKLRQGTDVLIATPGRLLDLIGQNCIDLSKIKHFVLDEADRMLDMGFIKDINRLLTMLPKQRQTLFFSATMPASIVTLSKSMLNAPQRVDVTPKLSVAETVEQFLYYVEKSKKIDLLIHFLNKESEKSVLVFSRTKHGADRIAKLLNSRGIVCEAIHSNKTQNARQKALTNFKSGKTRIVVATDIAARGIDVANLELVINFDMPDVAETYVHRIGRTGRAGQSGTALSFCTSEEKLMVRDIQRLTGIEINARLIQA